MKGKDQKLPLLDIYQAAYLKLHGFTPQLTLDGGRVVFEFPATEEIYSHCKSFNGNSPVPVMDFVSSIRQLRSRMIALKEGR